MQQLQQKQQRLQQLCTRQTKETTATLITQPKVETTPLHPPARKQPGSPAKKQRELTAVTPSSSSTKRRHQQTPSSSGHTLQANGHRATDTEEPAATTVGIAAPPHRNQPQQPLLHPLKPGMAHDAEEAAPLGSAPETARTRIKQTEGSLYMQL